MKIYYDPEYDREVNEEYVRNQYEWFNQYECFTKPYDQFVEENFRFIREEIKMYRFVAYYICISNEEKIEKSFEVNSQIFDSEKEVYLYAMEKAIDMLEYGLSFDSLELIYC